MELMTKWYVWLSESKAGQTMTEYALIMAAIAVAAYATYNALGGGVNTLINTVKSDL
jgi:Flp pilus assembly pilin Flp